ncbi:hypothetical protein [Peristeroidobacter soli]|uniref:hypothetical protein n=1 Tax=Peristeroidobacter soli TaxID=2497877 RepID=UPI001C37AFAD|nr:hypothetical protein [Peristeroidobacter soli]
MVLAAGAILHFVYESIVAPSLRLELRLALIRLEDEVRLLRIQTSAGAGEQFDRVERQLCELQDSIHSLACILFKFDLVTIYTLSKEIDRDAGLKRRVEARARILDDCVVPRGRALRSEQIRIATKALAVNSGPMLLWLVVPVSLFVGYHAVFNKIKNSLTVPAHDLKRLMLDEEALVA